MQNRLFRKCLVVGIIILFVGACVVPSISGNIKTNNKESDEKNVYIANHIGPSVDDWAIIDTVGWWHFDEGTGDTAYDSSTYDNDGFCSSTQWTTDTPDASSYALEFFASSNSFVGVDDDPSLNFNDLGEDEGFMIDFYMKKKSTPTVTYSGLVCKQYYGGYLVVYHPWGEIGFYISSGSVDYWGYSETIIDDNDWHHIVCVWDRAIMYIYIDDMTNPDNTLYVGDFTIGGTSKWVDIGNDWPSDWNNPFNGKIDEVKISIIRTNDPPNAPIIDGPPRGSAGNSYPYRFTSEDPDEDDVSYYIEWGDGDTTTWTEFRPSGSPGYSESHSWTKGTFIIQAIAKDIYGAESDWAELTVSMPRNRAINGFFLRFLEQFPILQKIFIFLTI
jgi:hypothetical protein